MRLLIILRIASIHEWEKGDFFLHLSLSADKLIRFLCVCWQMMSRSFEENLSAVNGTIIILLIVVKRNC